MKSIKRIGMLLVAGLLVVTAYGCSDNGGGANTTTTASPAAPAATATP
jgi:hypothetical protein